MDLRFESPDLATLDRGGTELLLLSLFEDEKPPRGVAGLFDWRAAGRLSKLMLSGFASGELGEVLLTPARPGLPFDKVILFGGGRLDEFDEEIFASLLLRVLDTVEGLRVRAVMAQLPGRHCNAIQATRAIDLLLEAGEGRQDDEVWTLLEDSASQRLLHQHLIDKRRRSGR